jgi:hypothetical protein
MIHGTAQKKALMSPQRRQFSKIAKVELFASKTQSRTNFNYVAVISTVVDYGVQIQLCSIAAL